MKALLAVKNGEDRLLIANCLSEYRIPVRSLEAGEPLDKAYPLELPELVILDSDWQEDNTELLRQLRNLRPSKQFLHVLLLTTAHNQPSALLGLRYAQDLLYQPCVELLVKKKLHLAILLSKMHTRLAHQQQRTLDIEYELDRYKSAGEILNTLIEPCRQHHANIKHLFLPAAKLSGDLLLVEHAPNDNQYILLGDITGHGFTAFMGALPVTQFYSELIQRSVHLGDLVSELNKLIHSHLSDGIFAAVAVVELNHALRRARIWNGGLPHTLIWRAEQAQLESLPPLHCAMGIVPYIDIDYHEILLAKDDAIYLYTDGLIEARNPQEQPFTRQRLEACLQTCNDAYERFDRVCLELNRFIGNSGLHDDITFIEIVPQSG